MNRQYVAFVGGLAFGALMAASLGVDLFQPMRRQLERRLSRAEGDVTRLERSLDELRGDRDRLALSCSEAQRRADTNSADLALVRFAGAEARLRQARAFRVQMTRTETTLAGALASREVAREARETAESALLEAEFRLGEMEDRRDLHRLLTAEFFTTPRPLEYGHLARAYLREDGSMEDKCRFLSYLRSFNPDILLSLGQVSVAETSSSVARRLGNRRPGNRRPAAPGEPSAPPRTAVIPTAVIPTAVIPTAVIPTAVIPTAVIPTAVILTAGPVPAIGPAEAAPEIVPFRNTSREIRAAE